MDKKKIMLSQKKRPPLNLVSSSLQKNGVSYDSKKPILVNVVRVNILKSQVDEQEKEATLFRDLLYTRILGEGMETSRGRGEIKRPKFLRIHK